MTTWLGIIYLSHTFFSSEFCRLIPDIFELANTPHWDEFPGANALMWFLETRKCFSPLEVWEREQEMTQCQSFSSAFPGTQDTPWAPDSLFLCLRESPCYPSSIFLGSIYGSFQCKVINYPYLCKNPTEDECLLSGNCLVCSAQTLVPPKKQSILLTLVSCLGSQHEINAQQAALKLAYRWPWQSLEFILIEIQSIEVFSCGWQWLTGPDVSTYLCQVCWPAGWAWSPCWVVVVAPGVVWWGEQLWLENVNILDFFK